jgi:hypothetical protein
MRASATLSAALATSARHEKDCALRQSDRLQRKRSPQYLR